MIQSSRSYETSQQHQLQCESAKFIFLILNHWRMSKECPLRQYQSFRMSNSSKMPHFNSSPTQSQTFSQNQLRVKTLPDQLYHQASHASLKADAYSLANNQKLVNSVEKSSNHNNIEYFELDLKNIIKSNKQQLKSVKNKENINQKQNLSKVLCYFLKKLHTLQENQIDQLAVRQLHSHFSNLEGKPQSKLKNLMSLSINQLKNNSSKPKHLEPKTQRSLFDKKYNKYYYRSDHLKCKEKLNQTSTICSKVNKEEVICNFECKKIVKTMVDQQGNQFRVTVQKVK